MEENRNAESGSNRHAYSEKEEFTDDGNGLIVTEIESVVGKTGVSRFCALAGEHNESASTEIHKTSDLYGIFSLIRLL